VLLPTQRLAGYGTLSAVDTDGFWQLIERSARETSGKDERARWLVSKLARVPRHHILDFQICLDGCRRRLDTFELWGAAGLIFEGFCSDDSFWYFTVWVIGTGRQSFEEVCTSPDNLVDVPEVARLARRPRRTWSNEEWPAWELLGYVARKVYDEMTGEEDGLFDALEARGHISPSVPRPAGNWPDLRSPGGYERHYPRLSRMFPPPTSD
jgi:hypothetical protein